MACITLGIGTSHSPILNLPGDNWQRRAEDDLRSRALYMLDGRKLTYDELVMERGTPYAEESDPFDFPRLAGEAEAALDRIEAYLHAARPDVVLVIGDDQDELFGYDNLPAISVYRGEEIVMKETELPHPKLTWSDKTFWAGYAMDLPRRFPGAPKLADDLIRGLIARGVDVATSNDVPDPQRRAFGHAYGFVYQRLMKNLQVPMLPVLLNTYFPPNNPTSARCHYIGGCIAEALAASPIDAKVAIVASGGLSHFLCEAAFDQKIIDAIKNRDKDTLTSIPQESLCSGSSEIRNWIAMAGALGELDCVYDQYIPVYRTPAGTGIGLGFAVWQ
ncbi:protocatechuate 3,4-dioxygenase [Paraburkholderia sp. LEh10]|uniref:DODA-type extradiol aromatic ring-opening family dioxygenase n=1 Tax=Paraburkholderia sp. LEh10 TaxID=2821353 RepID=UPI001AE90C27|nr:protocatechuate 3,4-dioxygenase [Paraburkholderia sp. LEh10]MBP0594900.1 protocatechuate 3,4-dioxygenase [Paraburkholderia sp. LEh10]